MGSSRDGQLLALPPSLELFSQLQQFSYFSLLVHMEDDRKLVPGAGPNLGINLLP